MDNLKSIRLQNFRKGLWTKDEYFSDDVPLEALVEAQNIDMGGKSSLAPRLGSEVLGTASSAANPIISLPRKTLKSSKGRELLVRSHSTVLEWWNEIAETWETWDTGYTSEKEFDFTIYDDYIYLSNGAEALSRARMSFGTVASNAATTLTLNPVSGFSDASDLGFLSGGGTVIVDGTEYTYTGYTGWQLTGLSALPTFTVNDGVMGAVSTAGFSFQSGTPTGNKLLVKNERLLMATGITLYVSKIAAPQDFRYSVTRTAEEGDIVYFPEGGGEIVGLADKGSYIAVFKKDNSIVKLEFKDFGADAMDIPTQQGLASGMEISAVNNKSIIEKDYTVVYASKDIGLMILGRKENNDFDEPIRQTERIRPTLESYNFDDTAVGLYKRKIVNSAKHNTTVTQNDRVILWDYEDDWLSTIVGWPAKNWTVFNNKLYFGDAWTQNIREAFKEGVYDDDGNSFVVKAKTRWLDGGIPETLKELGWIYVEGFMTTIDEIDLRLNFDLGKDGLGQWILNGMLKGVHSYVSSPVVPTKYGQNPFGIKAFGEVTGAVGSTPRHFSRWIKISSVQKSYKFYRFQWDIESNVAGQNWRISKLIAYWKALPVQKGRVHYPTS